MNTEKFCAEIGLYIKGKSNGELVGDCPFCKKVNHFYMDQKSGLYHCKKCHEKGNPVSLLQKTKGLTGKEAFNILDKYSLSNIKVTPEKIPNNNRLLKTFKDGLETIEANPGKIDELIQIRKFKNKSKAQKLIMEFRIGFDKLGNYLIPLLDATNNLVGLQRFHPKGVLVKNAKGQVSHKVNHDGKPVKSASVWGSKNKLFGYRDSINNKDIHTIIICEAPFKALHLQIQGFDGAEGIMAIAAIGAGNIPIDMLDGFKDKHIVFCYDFDFGDGNPGQLGVKSDIEKIKNIAKSIKNIIPTQEIVNSFKAKGYDKVDLADDFWIENGNVADFKKLIDSAYVIVGEFEVPGKPIDSGSNGDPILSRFFEKNVFVPLFVTRDILKEHKILYADKQFYLYRKGVWVVIDADYISELARNKLGKHSRNNRICETVTDVKLDVLLPDSKKLNDKKEFINLENGSLNWIDKTLVEHDPEQLSTVRINASYDPKAKCDRFLQFLEETLEPDTIPIVQEIFGYCSIQDVRFEKAFLFIGGGANGKGTLIDSLLDMLGKDNVSQIPLQSLGDRFQTAQLKGKLANIFTDLNARALQDTGFFKAVVSGDQLTCERKHENPFSFAPFARLIFSCNEIPRSYDRTYAFYRRWIIIPFNKTFSGAKRDKSLKFKLKEERDGIFVWALEGLHRLFKQQDFSTSESVDSLLDNYKLDNNNVLLFTKEQCEFDENMMVDKTILYDNYKKFCHENTLRHVSQRKFNIDLIEKNINIRETMNHISGKRAWRGVGLVEDSQIIV